MTLKYLEIRVQSINSFFNRRCPRQRRRGCISSLIAPWHTAWLICVIKEKNIMANKGYYMYSAHIKKRFA